MLLLTIEVYDGIKNNTVLIYGHQHSSLIRRKKTPVRSADIMHYLQVCS